MPRIIELNLTRNQARDFIDWLANDTYWGHTFSRAEKHYDEADQFLINGHRLSTYSNVHHEVIIDDVYRSASHIGLTYDCDGKEYTNIDYCLHKLGFDGGIL